MARDLSKGPTNSYWGSRLNRFLNGEDYADVKWWLLSCTDDTEARNATIAFRAFKKHYDLPIDISKDGNAVRVIHEIREGDVCLERTVS